MTRPTGVTVIAILYFISAVGFILGGILFAVGGSLIGLAGGASGTGEGAIGLGFIAGLGILGAIVMFCLGLIPGIVGWGLLKLKNWARIVAIIFSGLSALTGALGALMLEPMSIITLAVNAWIVFYLLKPHVKAAFGVA